MKGIQFRKRLRRCIGLNHKNESKRIYLIPVISIIIGTVLGTAAALVLSGDTAQKVSEYLNNFFSVYSLHGVNKGEIFKISMYNNLKMLLILWMSGLSVFLLPFLSVYIAGKGFKLGFAISFLIKTYSYAGAFLSCTSMLSQALIIIPTLIIFSAYSIRLALKLKWIRRNKVSGDEKRKLFLSNLSAIILSVLVMIFASYIDSYIVPLISVPIYMGLS